MAKVNKPEQTSELTEIVTEQIGDFNSEAARQAEVLRTPKIVIDGIEYDADYLSAPAKGAIASLQFSEAKLMALQNEMAICQTAYFAYVKCLKAELEGKPRKADG